MSVTHCTSFSPRYIALEKTQSPWQILVVRRLKKDGSLYLDDKGKIQEYSYTWDRRTGDLYCTGGKVDNKEQIIRKKCIGIFLATPFFTACQILFQCTKILLNTIKIASRALKEFCREMYYRGAKRALKGMIRASWEITKTNLGKVWEIARAFFLGVALQTAAFYGIFHPYEGRKWAAKVEHRWQHGISWKKDIKIVDDIRDAKVCFLAQCFQIRAHIDDPDLRIVRKGELL